MANSPLLVYISAPYADASSVPTWHTQLASIGCQAVDTWASSPEPDLTQGTAANRAAMLTRAAQIASAHLIVTAADPSVTGDYHFCDTLLAYGYGIPVMWVGALPGASGSGSNGAAVLHVYQSGIAQVPDAATAKSTLSTLVPVLQPTLNGGSAYAVRQAIFQRWQ